MDTNKRQVVGLPLDRLRDERGPMDAYKRRELSADDIRAMLRVEAVRFVVADCGLPLSWVESTDCYDFWKREVQPHLYDEARPYLDGYPGGYFYFADEWQLNDGELVIALEKRH